MKSINEFVAIFHNKNQNQEIEKSYKYFNETGEKNELQLLNSFKKCESKICVVEDMSGGDLKNKVSKSAQDLFNRRKSFLWSSFKLSGKKGSCNKGMLMLEFFPKFSVRLAQSSHSTGDEMM